LHNTHYDFNDTILFSWRIILDSIGKKHFAINAVLPYHASA